jgi:hypothetical protein
MFHQKRDLVSAALVTNKTFVVPKPVRAFEHRKGGVLIVVPNTTRRLFRLLTVAKPFQQFRQWEKAFGLVNLRP